MIRTRTILVAVLASVLLTQPGVAAQIWTDGDGDGLPDARIIVFDTSGRRLRTLALDGIAPGLNNAVWNGRNDSGNQVGAGVYFARLSWNGVANATERVTIVR